MRSIVRAEVSQLEVVEPGQLAPTVPIATLRLTIDEILAPFTPKVRDCLQRSNRELIRAAVHLTRARQAVEQSSTALIGHVEGSFEAWYEKEFKLSADKASRLMRWVKPVLDQVQWDNEADPIFQELAEIGPCRCTEAYKLEANCRFNSDNKLVVRDVDRGIELLVSEMTHRELVALRVRNSKAQLADSANLEQLIAPQEFTSETAAPPADISPQSDGAEEANPGPSPAAPSPPNNVVDLARSDTGVATAHVEPSPDLWEYQKTVTAKLQIIDGKLAQHVVGADIDAGASVYAVNVHFELVDGALERRPVSDAEDAFCVVRIGAQKYVHWWDHLTAEWQLLDRQVHSLLAVA